MFPEHDLTKVQSDGTFGALLLSLELVWKELKAEFRGGSWADRQLLTEMENWIRNRFDGSQYNYFAAFARQFCQFDDRRVVNKLKNILFPANFPNGVLVFHEGCGCWTLGLDASQQIVATHGFLDARILIAETLVRMLECDKDARLLSQKYFDNKLRQPIEDIISFLAKEFERLDAALDSNLLFVLCKGNEARGGNRTQAYVDPGLDMCVFPACARASRSIYLNRNFFRGRETVDQYSISGEQLLYFGMTIVHELTHHILKTEDVQKSFYGREKCFWLADRLAPRDGAMINADNFSLFARDLKLCQTGSKPKFLTAMAGSTV